MARCLMAGGLFVFRAFPVCLRSHDGRSLSHQRRNKLEQDARQMQQLFYGKRYSAVCLRKRRSCPANCKGPNEACPPYTPDFVALAESYGAHGIRVDLEEHIQEYKNKARTYKDAPTVIEFLISSDEIVLPMVKGGNPMSEMILK